MPEAIPPRSARKLVWVTSVDTRQLKREGYAVWKYGNFQKRYVVPARNVTEERPSLDNAAAPLMDLLNRSPRLAVIGVPARTVADVADIYGFLVEPAYRRNLSLLIQADRDLGSLEADELINPRMRYAADHERLSYLAHRYLVRHRVGLPSLTPIEASLLRAMREESLSPEVHFGVGPYVVDFAFPAHRLTVEADGRGWHDARRDAARDTHLAQLGWETVRITGASIYRDAPSAARRVAEALGARDVVVDHSPVASTPQARRARRGVRWVPFVGSPLSRDRSSAPDELPPPWEPPRPVPLWKAHLDADQRRAIDAHEGVVQVIAPAGSGKTTVIIGRVHELLSRGVPANRILCTTFNRAASDALDDRLKQVAAAGIEVRSFHALGRQVLEAEGRLRSDIGSVSSGQWRSIALNAMQAVDSGVWFDAPVAADLVTEFKLAKGWTPAEARERATNPEGHTAAAIYALYEDELERADRNDVDDLILNAVVLLQHDADARRRWQQRWDSILVDEYQDIEPAQELLVRLLAAPQDAIFAVGDEDQCLHSWRHASVQRMVMLDVEYPGLERIVLGTSYRCPAAVIDAAKRLIEHNFQRFPKQIRHAATTPTTGEIICQETTDLSAGAKHVAALLDEHLDHPDRVVVLARTTRLLQAVARACVKEGIPIRAPEGARRLSDSATTVLAFLRLSAMPRRATADDVATTCRVPNRHLPNGAEHAVAARLRAGDSFASAVTSLNLRDTWRGEELDRWAALFTELADCDDAGEAVRLLRTDGGLDQHYARADRMSRHDQVELDTLHALEEESSWLPVSAFVTVMERRARLDVANDDPDGIELSTIHAAKGREWDTVILFGADGSQLPHLRAVIDAESDDDLRDALEAERRLLYVGMTRTRQTLHVVTTGDPSPFLDEAGILSCSTELPTFTMLEAFKERNGPATSLVAHTRVVPAEAV